MASLRHIEELRLLTKVAHLYHLHGLNQRQIAQRLDLSQATVSRLLKRALTEGVVRITVSMPAGVFGDLEEELCSRYALREAVIVDAERPDDEAGIQRSLGVAAAFYLENTLKQDEVIGISSWSATLLAVVDAMHPVARPSGAVVVQILGGIGHPEAEVHASRLTERLAKLVNGTGRLLTAPGIVGSLRAREILLEDPYVAASVALFDHLTLALVGIGSVQPSRLLASSGNIYSDDELDLLRRGGAVGDVCLRFFDAAGRPVLTPLDKRVIGIPLEKLQRVERSIGIAGSARKHAAIRGALMGRLINVLITDRFTAESLL